MGSVQSSERDSIAMARNDEIEKQLKRDRMVSKNEIKILIIGSRKSGKSKALQQMKLIHYGGYSESERESYKKIIFSNTLQCMRAILQALPQLDIELLPSNDGYRNIILSAPPKIEAGVLPRVISDAIRILWRDPSIKEAIRRSREFMLNKEAVYYFNSIDRMASSSYLPTDQDILRSRVNTSGVTETTFKIGELTYRMLDIGKQRGECKKWIHCFENVEALVFFASLSEYDQVLYEDESVVCILDLFSNSTLGGDNYDAACDYMLRRYVSLNQSSSNKQIYAHYTCTSDTQQVKFVLSAIQDILLQIHLRECEDRSAQAENN